MSQLYEESNQCDGGHVRKDSGLVAAAYESNQSAHPPSVPLSQHSALSTQQKKAPLSFLSEPFIVLTACVSTYIEAVLSIHSIRTCLPFALP